MSQIVSTEDNWYSDKWHLPLANDTFVQQTSLNIREGEKSYVHEYVYL